MNTRTPNKQLTDKRDRLRQAAKNYQSTLSWYQENLDSPNAEQDCDEATAAFKREIGHRETDIVADLLDEIDELQERLKATMDNEPVAWTDEQELRDVEKDGYGYLFKTKPITPNADPRRIIKLYRHAQPVPVALRNHFRAEALAVLLKDAREYAPLTAAQWEVLAKNWHQTFVGLSGEENACRAAMLKGGAA